MNPILPLETCFTSEKAETKNVTTRDAIIDIIGGDNVNEETSGANEKFSSVSHAEPRETRPRSKRDKDACIMLDGIPFQSVM